MDVTAELDGLRERIDGCDLAAYADTSSRMMLCSSAAAPRAQEELDRLAGAAAELLGGATGEGAGTVWSSEDAPELPALAVAMTASEMRVFLAAPDDRSEALILVCRAEADLDQALGAARSALAGLAAG